ncbi:MAG: acyl-CoA thioesterase [Granulosicoccus sp.]
MSEPQGHFLHQVDLPVRWGDMDALGHVNNCIYFQYFEITRLHWFDTLGFPPLATTDEGMVIVDNHAQYLKPVVYPMHITIRMSGHSPGRSSFISTYVLTVDGTVYTTGSAKIVWINTLQGKSVPLPDSIRAMLPS